MYSKLRTLWHTFTKTITEPTYYNDVLSAKFSFSLKYFFAFYFFLALSNTIHFSLFTLPEFKQVATDTISEVTQNYPPDLVITLEDNQLSLSGAKEPLNIPFPAAWDTSNVSDSYTQLASLDTATTSAAHATLLTFTKQDLIIRHPDDTKQTVPYADIDEDVRIDHNSISLMTSSLQSELDTGAKYAPYFLLFFLTVSRPILLFILLIFFATFVQLILSLRSKPIPYKKALQISLHLATFASLASHLKFLLFPGFPFNSLFVLAFFGAALITSHYINKSH